MHLADAFIQRDLVSTCQYVYILPFNMFWVSKIYYLIIYLKKFILLFSTTVFNINNNKKGFLSTKSALEWFERSCDAENWSNSCWQFSFASQE